MTRPCLRVVRLDPRASLPRYHSDQAAGLDLCACLSEPIAIEPGRIRTVPTGLAVQIPEGFEGQVRPRSGLASRFGVTLPNAPGTIDADYRGQVIVALINLGRQRFVVEHAMRVAQLVIAPVSRVEVIAAESLEPTARGAGGFGSTGIR